MKKVIVLILPLFTLLLSCDYEFDLDLGDGFGLGGTYIPPPGIPATFTITQNENTYVINGDAFPVGYGFFDGPGSAMHKESTWDNPPMDYYILECIGSYESGIHINFNLLTTSLGRPIDTLTTGIYYGRNSIYTNKDSIYQAYHYQDATINQQLFTVVNITKISEGRIDGSFSGKYYQTKPETGEIVTIAGEFKNVYVHMSSW